MAQPSWQNNFNNQQRRDMNNMFAAITSGDVNRIENMLRSYTPKPGGTGDELSVNRDAYSNVLRQIASDYINLGGVSAETRALIDSQQNQGGYKHNRAERQSGERAALGVFKALAQALPQVSSSGATGQVKMMGLPPGMSPAEYLQLFVTNQLSEKLDPVSKQETQQWLARANPMLFRAYGMRPMQAAGPIEAGMTGDQLTKIASSLDLNTLRAQLPKVTQTAMGANTAGVGSGLDWMRRYLQTAAQGIDGTRGQQQLAAGQLETLNREAQGNRGLGQFATLAENLVNPVLRQSSLSNIIGQNRALSNPSGTFRRKGIVARNPYLV